MGSGRSTSNGGSIKALQRLTLQPEQCAVVGQVLITLGDGLTAEREAVRRMLPG